MLPWRRSKKPPVLARLCLWRTVATELGGAWDVTLINRSDVLLRGQDSEISVAFAEALGKRVKLRLNQRLSSMESDDDGSVVVVTADRNNVEYEYYADAVLVAAGRVRNWESLNLDAAGINVAKVVLHPMPVGGQSGRALENPAVAIAVRCAQAVGRPVQVTLSRGEAVRFVPPGPPLLVRLLARPQPDGTLSAWSLRLAGLDGRAESLARLTSGEPAFAADIVPRGGLA